MDAEKMGRMKYPVGIKLVGYFSKWVGYYPISDRYFNPYNRDRGSFHSVLQFRDKTQSFIIS